MTKPSRTRHVVITQSGLLGRSNLQVGLVGPANDCAALQRARLGDREAAGRIAPLTALFVSYKETILRLPHSLRAGQFGSVTPRLVREGLV